MNGRKTILLVDDDPGTLRVLSSGLANTLGMFDVATATNGREAIEVLDARPVDVVVTDLAMPVMDGFALIGHLTNRDATVPVVVLSALAPHDIDVGLNGYHGLTVLTKPAGHEEVASAVLNVLEQVERGQVEGIPLPSVLQLVEAERRTCTLVVTSGRRRGRLHFESGRLINAFSDDFGAEGEAAAHDVLSWERTAIEFDRLPDGIRRVIHLPTQAFLVEVARRQDEAQNALRAHAPLAPRVAAEPTPHDAWGTANADAVAAPSAAGPASDEPAPDPATADPAAPDPAAPEQVTAEQATAEADAPDAPAPDPAAPDGRDDPVPDEAASPAAAHEADAANDDPPGAPAIDPPSAAPFEATENAAPTGPDAVAPAAAAAPPEGGGTDAVPTGPESVRDLIAAIARLTDRVQAADDALAAVAAEVEAFHAAQQRYDAAVAQREAQRAERRRRTAAVRDDVAALAREILAKMDGLFDALSEDDGSGAPAVEPSGGTPTGP